MGFTNLPDALPTAQPYLTGDPSGRLIPATKRWPKAERERMELLQKHGYGLDRKTGKKITEEESLFSGRERYESGEHMFHLAGDHLFFMERSGVCWVVSLKPEIRLVAKNHLDGYTGENQAMWFSGNRIFVRTFSDVYCIGDPKEPMRLSIAQQ